MMQMRRRVARKNNVKWKTDMLKSKKGFVIYDRNSEEYSDNKQNKLSESDNITSTFIMFCDEFQ